LLDTRAMQRLRRIKQLGFMSYVFPCAEHSRFVHSLGVMHIMGLMCDALQSHDCLDSQEVIKLRIAALLHDVGHFPYSHLGEKVYSYDYKIRRNISNIDSVSGKKTPYETSLLSKIANHKKIKIVDHEHFGAKVIENDPEISKLLKDAGISPEEIGEIITGNISKSNLENNPHSYIYIQLLHSDHDADRMDYLLRDAYQTGLVFGKIELEYIINNFRVATISSIPKGPKDTQVVVIRANAQHAVEHFLMARYFHYSQAVFQKTSAAFEVVAETLMYKMLLKQSDNVFFKSVESLENAIGTDDYYDYTDEFLWTKLQSFSTHSRDPFIQSLWETIGQRKKPRHIILCKDIASKGSSEPTSNSTVSCQVIENVSKEYYRTKCVMEKHQKELAKKIPMEYLGYIEMDFAIESLPKHVKAEKLEELSIDEHIRDSIKIVDKSGDVTFLATNPTSLINKMVNYRLLELDVFIVDPSKKYNVENIRDGIMVLADGC